MMESILVEYGEVMLCESRKPAYLAPVCVSRYLGGGGVASAQAVQPHSPMLPGGGRRAGAPVCFTSFWQVVSPTAELGWESVHAAL